MRVLVVEDNALLRHHLKVQIQDAGHQVDDAEDAKVCGCSTTFSRIL